MNTSTLALMCVEGVGPRIFKALVQTFGSAENALQQDKHMLEKISGLTPVMADMIVKRSYRERMDMQIQWMEKHRALCVSQEDEAYPEVLRQIYDAPPVLMITGNFQQEDTIAFGVVGTRHPDDYGKHMTREIAGGIAKRGISIVSGMAKGVDAISHLAALDAGARTIAVLGTPLDCVYPAENRHIYEQIKAQGLVCSEILIGEKVMPGNFIRRNRIISGLSRGVVVTQAGTKSGALVTALNANEQNRDVFAVPGNCLKGYHTGCHRLIRLGAKIVENAEDILNEYPFLNEDLSPQKDWIIESAKKNKLSEDEENILKLLNREGVHIDVILGESGVARPYLMNALLNLEIKGYITVKPGNYYIRNI